MLPLKWCHRPASGHILMDEFKLHDGLDAYRLRVGRVPLQLDPRVLLIPYPEEKIRWQNMQAGFTAMP